MTTGVHIVVGAALFAAGLVFGGIYGYVLRGERGAA